MAKDLEGLPYQVGPQVHQLLTERANAEALGLTDRVEAVDKQLDQFGYSKGKASKKRTAAAEDDDDAKSEPPKERHASKQHHTAD